MGNLLSFREALKRFGERHEDQAKTLNVPVRTLTDYKSGRLPRFGRILLSNPALLEALLDDARNGRTNGNHATDPTIDTP